MGRDYKLSILSDELDKYKNVVFQLTEKVEQLGDENKRLKEFLSSTNNSEERYKLDLLVDKIAGLCCGVINGDYCNHCWKFQLPYFLKRIFCGKCIALQDIITDLHHILDTADDSHTIDELLNQLIDSREALEKIKVIALDIIENDCYENSDTKAKEIINIIYPLFLTDKEKQEAKELAEKISKYPEDYSI